MNIRTGYPLLKGDISQEFNTHRIVITLSDGNQFEITEITVQGQVGRMVVRCDNQMTIEPNASNSVTISLNANKIK